MLIVAMYTVMAAIGTWTPRLAVDLAGGISAIYTAKAAPGQTTISQAAMGTAVSIFEDRINAFGVSEASVAQEGADTIQVEVPGSTTNAQTQLNLIGQTALLYFRPVEEVAAAGPISTATATPSAGASGTPAPSAGASGTPAPSSTATGTSVAPKGTTSATPSTKASGASGQAEKLTPVREAGATTAPATPKATGSPAASGTPAASSAATAPATAPATAAPSATSAAEAAAEAQAEQASSQFNSLTCLNDTATAKYLTTIGDAKPTDYIATCGAAGTDAAGYKYLLGPELVKGTDVTKAVANPVETGSGSNAVATGAWEIDLSFNAAGKADFAAATTTLYQNYQSGQNGGQQTGPDQFAVTLDGQVYSDPAVNQGAITGGTATISGSFSEQTANQLATILGYGALPLTFNISQQSIISPTLGGSQLDGGLIAGAVGLLLVFLYVIFYYRALSVVAITSLFVAGSITYAAAVLLGPLLGFTLSLAGVAGLIVAIGITADSFVVFFERIRDEVREGRTMRSGIQHGWTRARRTIVASDFVSFLAAFVLYIFTVGEVQGFAFTLGLTTVVDIVVVFLFTKPLLTILSNTRFFGGGHKLSGVDPEQIETAAPNWRSGNRPRMTVAERRRAAEAAAAGEDPTEDAESTDPNRVEA
ncbi:MAG TPA: protein translocase subunit SecD [Actinocrinis sp.]|nr:protein translocase subunit SecD [Actinocrinis sp.]